MVTTREEAGEMAAAYLKGAQDAEGQLRQHIVAQKAQWTQVRFWDGGWISPDNGSGGLSK